MGEKAFQTRLCTAQCQYGSIKDQYINIPKDLSIVGYDNIELSEMIEPKLTTIDQNMFLLVKNSAILLN